jgi:hypothetical protein
VCGRNSFLPRVRPNPSIERTPYGMLRMPPVAAHVERYASALAAPCFVSRLVRQPVRMAGLVLGAAVPRQGHRAWLRSLFASGASRCAGRARGVRAVPAAQGERRAGAERPAVSSTAAVRVCTVGRAAPQCLFGPGSHNQSVERTNNGGPRLAVSPAVRAPLFAAHLQRYASALAAPCFVWRLVRQPVRTGGLVLGAAVPRQGHRAWLRSFFASGASRCAGRERGVRAVPAAQGERRAGAERPAVSSAAAVPVCTVGPTAPQCLLGPGSHNQSVERTNNGGPRLAVAPAVRAPLFAAHLQR